MSDITWTNETRRLRDLKPQADNPREIKKGQAARLVKSWHKFGQPDVISINPDNTILNGHQRFYVWGAAYGLDFEVAVRVASRQFTRAEWQEYTVVSHEGAVGGWDWEGLANWEGVGVAELAEWGFQAWQLGGASGGDDPNELWKGMPEFGQDDLSPHRTLNVHFASDEDVTDFAELVGQKLTGKTKYIWYPKVERANLESLRYTDGS